MIRFNCVLSGISEWGDGIGDQIKNNLIPSWLSLLVQLAAFVVLLIIVIFIAYKPVKRMLKKRQDYIEQEISDAEKSKAVALTNLAQSEEKILASKKEAALILEKANLEAKKQQEESLNAAREEIAKMKKQAELDIKKSRQEALDDIHKEMVEVAILTSSEILKREVNEKDNARLAEEFIKKL
ncbi:MAG: F0F1 ATP synthase subunit B [Bacilli bacterium]|nr:F0F1 ATP synthase subunit B [Bacilli bacterium]